MGCGYGGAAHYVYEARFSDVGEIALDLATISYAQRTYSALSFTATDGLGIDKTYPPSNFSSLYMFNSLYTLLGKLSLLRKLATIATPGSLSFLSQEFTEQDIAKTTKTFTVLLNSLK